MLTARTAQSGLAWLTSPSNLLPLFSWLQVIPQAVASLTTPSPTFTCLRHTLSFLTLTQICVVIYCTASVKSQSPSLDPELREHRYVNPVHDYISDLH